MYVLINGAFGIGKTTVARALRPLLSAAIFDPEIVGFVLQRLPGYRESDYQDLRSWRRLTVLGARTVGAIHRVVIIPMAISEIRYLDELRSGLASSTRRLAHFCLTAPLSVVHDRLAGRGEPQRDARESWVHRRAAECCVAHANRQFGKHVPTVGRSPADIAADIAAQISHASA